MLTSQNSAYSLRNWVGVVALFSMILSPVKGAPWKLDAELKPPQGGTVSPLGEYADGAKVNVVVTANPGWFIQYFSVTQATKDGLDDVAWDFFVHTTIESLPVSTNISATTTMTGNTKMTITFWPLLPTFVSIDGDIPTPADFDLKTNHRVVVTGDFDLYSYFKGRWPLTYEWRKDGILIPDQSGKVPRGQTYEQINFTAVDPSMSGIYSLTVKNDIGSETLSTEVVVPPILCREIAGSPVLTNRLFFTNSFVCTLETPYRDAHIYFTVDGGEPTFASQEYSPNSHINLFDTSVLRAVVYTSDFATSAFLGPIRLEKASTITFFYHTNGLGTIEGQIPNPTKASTVSLRAVPASGSFFVYWETPEPSENPEITIQADRDADIRANFATPFLAKVAGQGTVIVEPDSPGYLPQTPISLYPKPNSGFYFVRWSDQPQAIIPLHATTGATDIPTALFAPLPSGKVSLTVISKGPGFVSDVETNLYTTGTAIKLQAEPLTKNTKFLRWSGDIDSTNTSITLDLTSSKVIYAEFQNPPVLSLNSASLKVFSANYDGIGSVVDFLSSSNLMDWHLEFSKTNFSGVVFGDWAPTNAARFFRASQRGR